MRSKIRILIVDDHGVMRAGIRAIVEKQQDMEVVGEACDGEESVSMVHELIPDIVIMDIGLPRMSGIEAIKKIRETSHKTRVVAFTMHDEKAFVCAVMAAGGSGYVTKSAQGDELISAIRAVFHGRSHITASLSSDEIHSILGKDPNEKSSARSNQPKKLSVREQQVLEMLAQGYTNQEIGKALKLSIGTIGVYRFHISEKLGLQTRAEIFRYSLELGLLNSNKMS